MSKKKEKRERRKVTARQRVESHTGGFERTSLIIPDGVKMFVPEKGVHRFDVVPYIVGKGNPQPGAEPGAEYFERTYFVHRGIGPNNDTFTCLYKTFSKKCPICEERSRMAAGDSDGEAVKALAPKERQLFAIVELNKEGKRISDEVQVFDYSHHLFGKQLDAKVRNGDGEHDEFADLENGLSLRVAFEEQKQGGFSWVEATDIEFRARKEQYDPDFIESVPCLDDMVKEVPYDKLKSIFLQISEEDDDEDDEDEEPKRKPKHKPAKEEDENEEDDDEDDEDEESDEDDGDEDDDEDEPKPKGKKAPPAKGKGPAAKKGLAVGMKVEHEDYGVCEISHISGDGTSLRLEDSDGEEYRAIDVDDVEIVDEDEDEPKPKRGSKKAPAKAGKKKPSKDEDEDDDEDDEDDEDDD